MQINPANEYKVLLESNPQKREGNVKQRGLNADEYKNIKHCNFTISSNILQTT